MNSCHSLLQGFDGEEFLKCLKHLISIEREWVPYSNKCSLYIRPTLIATQVRLAVIALSSQEKITDSTKIPNLGEWDKSQSGNSQPSSQNGICLPNLGFLWVFFKYPKISKIGNPLFFPVFDDQHLLLCISPLYFIEIAECQPSSNYQASNSRLFLYISVYILHSRPVVLHLQHNGVSNFEFSS